MTGDFEGSKREMGRRNVDRTLDDNETISAGMRDASEEQEPDRYDQIFVHGALVGNSVKMLRGVQNQRRSMIRVHLALTCNLNGSTVVTF
jgi:hypothetical protein